MKRATTAGDVAFNSVYTLLFVDDRRYLLLENDRASELLSQSCDDVWLASDWAKYGFAFIS